MKEKLNTLLSKNTGKDLKAIEKDTERDYFLEAQEAVQYGLVDKVIENHIVFFRGTICLYFVNNV